MKLSGKVSSIVIGALVLFLAPSLILASSIPITGTAHAGPLDFGFSFSGPSLSLFSSTLDFVPRDGSGNKIPASFNFDGPLPKESNGTLNGVTADILVGDLNVSPSFGPGSGTFPNATVSGAISGYTLVNHDGGFSLGTLLFTVDISGTGTLTETGSLPPGADFTSALYTFSGTASPTPEPASLLLFSTGLFLLAFLAHRRMKKINC